MRRFGVRSLFTCGIACWFGFSPINQLAATRQDAQTNQLNQQGTTPSSRRQKPYFEMSPDQRREFVSRVHQVQLGATRQSIETLLGKPDLDIAVGKKERSQPTGRRVRYYVTLYEKDSANDRLNKSVTFRFDLKDHLQRIDSNVPEISSRP